ncbi:hypothetical protein WJX75_003209 [Coccomyxa subellipsoidea]|uniref:Uncharacterized protein n=1 Tax=Coccomyxa subellipsoidea TaxID=248742 RepID=A0ABR2YR04_9CHLO
MSRLKHDALFEGRVVTPADWKLLRTWRRHLPDLTWVTVLTGYWLWVVYFTLIAVLIGLYHTILVPRGAPDWPPKDVVPVLYQPFAITSFALALLMVFRTNSSYSRWWEARTVWGQVFNVTRNLVRQAGAWFGKDEEAEFQMLVRWCAALGYILNAHLCGAKELAPEAEALLRPEDLKLLASWEHRPICAGQVLSSVVVSAVKDSQIRAAMDDQIATYLNDAGACERIQKTCIPYCYTRHTSRFLILWLTFLPFALWGICGWASPLAEAVLAFLLMGVENIGIQIEEPFHVLPMDTYCAVIAKNALEVARERKGLDLFVEQALKRELCQGPVSKLKNGGSGASMLTVEEVGVSHKTCLKPTVPALRVRCQSQSSNNANSRIQEARGVFQMIPQRGEATLLDARDALETCSALNDASSKEACYATFGCDGSRVEQYFGAVEILETAWEQVKEEEVEDDDEFVEENLSPWPWDGR